MGGSHGYGKNRGFLKIEKNRKVVFFLQKKKGGGIFICGKYRRYRSILSQEKKIFFLTNFFREKNFLKKNFFFRKCGVGFRSEGWVFSG